MKRTLATAALILISLLVALGLAEWAVRKFNPQLTGEVVFGYHKDLGAIGVPNQRGRKTAPQGHGYNFSHNSLGFRGSREYGPDKGAAFRVLFLGDSFTYGLGVNDEQAFPQQVEAILRAKNYSVEVINAGSPGKGTDYELRLLQILGPQLKPDLVALCFFWNDYYDNVEEEYFRRGKNEELMPQKPHSLTAKKAMVENLPPVSWLLSWSHAANLLRTVKVNLLKRPGIPINRQMYNLQVPNYDKGYTQIFLNQVITTTKAMGSDLLFFYLPDEGQAKNYRKSREISGYEKDFTEMVQSQNREVYSLTPALSTIPGDVELPHWGHYNAGANLVAAQYISGAVESWLQRQEGRRAERP